MTRSAVGVRGTRALVLGLLAVAGPAGCGQQQRAADAPSPTQSSPPPSPRVPPLSRRPVPKPPEAWFAARSFGLLPLSRAEVPPTGALLAQSIVDAWQATSLKFPDPSKVVTIVGGRYPAVDALRVDLSNSQLVENGKKRAPIGEPRPTSRGVAVRHFALVAEPGRARGATLNMQLTGEDVRFELQRDKERNPLLVMTEASAGTLHFDAAVADLEKVMLRSARESGGNRGVYVRSIRLKLTSRSQRALDAELHVAALVGFVPAGITFRAKVDIDASMNARVHHLDVEGDDVFGPLMTLFIRPGLAAYEGKTKPLISFPGESVRLTDVRVRAGERVAVDAVFGR